MIRVGQVYVGDFKCYKTVITKVTNDRVYCDSFYKDKLQTCESYSLKMFDHLCRINGSKPINEPDEEML